MTSYSLTKQGREWKGKGTHATAVIEALKALKGKATGAAIADYVEEKKLLAGSKMDEREACSSKSATQGISWMRMTPSSCWNQCKTFRTIQSPIATRSSKKNGLSLMR